MDRRVVIPTLGLIVIAMAALGVVTMRSFTQTAAAQDVSCSVEEELNSYWKLDDDNTTFVDKIGTQDATCTDNRCPGITTGLVGGARNFDGGDDGLVVPTNEAYAWAADGSFSFEFWIKNDATPPTPEPGEDTVREVVIGRRGESPMRWWVGRDIKVPDADPSEATVQYLFQLKTGNFIEGPEVPYNDDWTHVVAVRDGDAGTNTLYVNGEEIASQNATYPASFDTSANITIGWYNNAFYNSGTIDELAVYNRALPVAEIQQHFNSELDYCTSSAATVEVSASAAPDTISAGETTTVTYTLDNASADIDTVSLTDAACPASPLGSGDVTSGDDNEDSVLNPDETWTLSCAITPTETFTGTATVAGEDASDQAVGASDTYTVTVLDAPLVIEEYTVSPSTIAAGESVTYTYTLRNNDDSPLTNVAVTDDSCTPVTPVDGDGPLAPDATRSYTCTTTIDVDTTSSASATATDSEENTVTSAAVQATVNVVEPGEAAIAITKEASETVVAAGTDVTYTYTVDNAGEGPLTSVAVTDTACTPIELQSGDANSDTVLDEDETWTYTCVTAVTEEVSSAAEVTAQDVDSNAVTATSAVVTVSVQTEGPAIAITKAASATVVEAGTDVTYTYTVDNMGNDALSSVAVSDAACSPVTATAGDTNTNGAIDTDETWTFTCTTPVNETTTTAATVTATASDSSTVTDTSEEVTVTVSDIGGADDTELFLPIIVR